MSARVPVALFALLVFTVAIGPFTAVGPAVSTAAGQATADQTAAAETGEIAPGTTAITIRLQSDGDAVWTITTRINASNEEEREAFRKLASQYENGGITSPWLDKVRAANDAAQRSTGRTMDVTDVRKSSNVDNTTLTLRFTWTDFAREEQDHMVVDDAFNTSRGTWLDGLTENQELTIELPEGYAVVSAPKAVQNARIHWEGPQQFEPGYMRIVYSGNAGPTGPTASSLLWGGFFILGVGIVVVGAYVITQRRDGFSSSASSDGDDPAAPRGSTSAPSTSDATDTEPATAATVEPSTEDDIEEELLSDEERVERLLESNGGRMKQANIVKETGWSNAKVSQLLSTMAEDGTIDKLRIGRENLISFPDEDITDIDQD